jgi:FeS assembly SUF system protein
MFWGRRKKEENDVPNEESMNEQLDLPDEAEAIAQPTIDASAANAEPDSDSSEAMQIRDRIISALKTIYDPEIPVDIYELGLIYEVDARSDGRVQVKMTLTSPACPVAGSLPGEVETKIRTVDGVTSVEVQLVWDPPWDKDMMSEAAQVKLGFF